MAVTVNVVVFFELTNLIIWFIKKICEVLQARLSVTLNSAETCVLGQLTEDLTRSFLYPE